MACKSKPQLYWVATSGQTINNRGFKSIVEARRYAVNRFKKRDSAFAKTYGYLDILKAPREPFSTMDYQVVGTVSRTSYPNVFNYEEYAPNRYGRGRSIGVKTINENGNVIRRG